MVPGIARRRGSLIGTLLVLGACASPARVNPPGAPGREAEAPTPNVPAAPADLPLPPAPWSVPALPAAAVPAVYLTEWRKAENRAGCALIAPERVGAAGTGATPRPATFSGGWAVAYDLPGTRSAFGVAGAAVDARSPDTYSAWPHRRRWADGSEAGYGPEGGVGPNQLAYLAISGQNCLYNVWSRISREHLEELLGQLRRVDTR